MKATHIKLNRLKILATVFVWAVYFLATVPLALGYIPNVVLPVTSLLANTLILAVIFYTNYYVIIPFIIKRFHSGVIVLSLLLSILLVVVLRIVIDRYYYTGLYVNGKEFLQYPNRLLTSGLFMLLSTVFAVLEHNEKHKRTELQLLNEKLRAELQFLKLQINPHFLFNALNNIYTLSYLKDEKVPEITMKLSEILRYMLYECKENRVPLQKEILILENYIELQKLKGDRQEPVAFTKRNIGPEQKIAPLILINFVENAFKHSQWGSKREAEIKLSATVNEKDELHFRIQNTTAEAVLDKNGPGGVGLANAKKQLELAYPGRYSLVLNRADNRYAVDLKILL